MNEFLKGVFKCKVYREIGVGISIRSGEIFRMKVGRSYIFV